jgi:NADPH:quinone reductase-like Zn-dependent oxidoreductase
MRAVLIRRYGGPEVVEVADVEAPVPQPGEVLVRVRASSVNPIDWRIATGALKLFVRHSLPMILGVDVAGVVSALGEGATRLAVGDEVFAMSPNELGASAQYIALPESLVVKKPANVTMEEAASMPAVALTALQSLRDLGHLHEGQQVLVNGASGGVGVFAVQLAKVLGAKVTGVTSPDNAELVRGLGADRIVDYKTTDFTREGIEYDVVFDCIGKRTFGECKPALAHRGTYISTEAVPSLFLDVAMSALFSRKAKAVIVKSRGEDLDFLRDLVEKGRVKPVVDRVFPLDAVLDAYAYSRTGRVRGKIVLTVP